MIKLPNIYIRLFTRRLTFCFLCTDSVAGVRDGVRGVSAGHAAGRGAGAVRARAGVVPAAGRARRYRRHGFLLARRAAHNVSCTVLTPFSQCPRRAGGVSVGHAVASNSFSKY